MTPKAPPLRLNNVFAKESSLTSKVSATLSPEVYDYFFRHLVAGHRGPHQAIISIFFKKFYEYCTQVEKIPRCYDPENENHLAIILNRLNFNEPAIAESHPAPDNRGTPSRRRPDPRAPKFKRKPVSPDRNGSTNVSPSA